MRVVNLYKEINVYIKKKQYFTKIDKKILPLHDVGNTVVLLLLATLNRDHPLECGHTYLALPLQIHLLLSLSAKGHLSNVGTLSWQTGCHSRGTTVITISIMH